MATLVEPHSEAQASASLPRDTTFFGSELIPRDPMLISRAQEASFRHDPGWAGTVRHELSPGEPDVPDAKTGFSKAGTRLAGAAHGFGDAAVGLEFAEGDFPKRAKVFGAAENEFGTLRPGFLGSPRRRHTNVTKSSPKMSLACCDLGNVFLPIQPTDKNRIRTIMDTTAAQPTSTNAPIVATTASATTPEAVGSSEYLSIPERMNRWRVALTNATAQPEIAEALAQEGLTAEIVAEGMALHGEASRWISRQVKELGEQIQATEQRDLLWEEANQEFGKHYGYARIAFRNEPSAIAKLGMRGGRSKTLAEWLNQAGTFYRNLVGELDESGKTVIAPDETLLTALHRYQVTPEKLRANQQRVRAVLAAAANQKKETGEAQDATVQRDHAIEQIADFMREFTPWAELALQDRPQLLEALYRPVES